MSCLPHLFRKKKKKQQPDETELKNEEKEAEKTKVISEYKSATDNNLHINPNDGISQLLEAERRAKEKINEARQRKRDLLKKASDVAKFESQQLTRKIKEKYDKEYAALKASREQSAMEVDRSLAKTLKSMNDEANYNYSTAIKLLFERVVYIDLKKYSSKESGKQLKDEYYLVNTS
ncbi:hypothetical protein HELRODRAFT_159295 [Helobdella robusta]|uniref:V-type proton ATPase subunit G n=1 Tax=Helobdella robusta TaxID=6412 RepID=T1ENU7_HELRO|nr:hypothetical protein HELRODRAFT_159295 [Helobdella robusta]ESO12709.1 hypothetical protein HELRODRAFT_159295 [Helobdella robusta]